MTKAEAIKILEVAIREVEWYYPMEYAVAFDMAKEALEDSITAEKLLEEKDK